MKGTFTLLFATVICVQSALAYNGFWKQYEGRVPTKGTKELNPEHYTVYALGNEIKQQLFNLSSNPASGITMDLPLPDGGFRTYKIWEHSIMEPALAAQFPEIKSFTGYAMDDKAAIAVLDYSPKGFHAMILDGANTYFIDPYSNVNDGYYLCYYKRDYKRPAGKEAHCSVADTEEDELKTGRVSLTNTGLPDIAKMTNGTDKRTYRLALACSGEYSIKVDGPNPTKNGVLAVMNTSMTRINGVYRSELGIEMILIANNADIIYLDPATDPYDDHFAQTMRDKNQTVVNGAIGAGNYDMGHVFDAGQASGVAELGVICRNAEKAKGLTGQVTPIGDAFDIDFVAHEMGHQFGAKHTFNASTGQCGPPNGAVNSAYEPGSGSTIMAYAGICGINDLQLHSDDFFHAHSLEQIGDFVINNSGASCASLTASGNNPATMPSVNSTYHIPYLTPFELVSPTAADADHDALTYCWEEWDLGDFGVNFAQTTEGPIFRSFKPVASETRVFPALDQLRGNVTSYLGEKLPSVERVMRFKLTVRDILNTWGIFNTSDDVMTLLVVNTGTPFAVKTPDSKTAYWQVNSSVEVTWEAANTNNAPINTSGVDIYLSLDDGKTYPYLLAQNIPNTGSATVTVPADAHTASARVKVKGAGNVFFDISNEGFVINSWPAGVDNITWANDISIFPVPAKDLLNITMSNGRSYTLTLFNALGQQVWNVAAAGRASVNVGSYAKGVYSLRITDANTGERIVKQVTIQ